MLRIFVAVFYIFSCSPSWADPDDSLEQEFLREIERDFFVPNERVTVIGPRIPRITIDGTDAANAMRQQADRATKNAGSGIVGTQPAAAPVYSNDDLVIDLLSANTGVVIATVVTGLALSFPPTAGMAMAYGIGSSVMGTVLTRVMLITSSR